MRQKLNLIWLILIFVLCHTENFAQQPRSEIIVLFDGKQSPETLYKKSYALLIGVSDYTAGWDKLPGVKSDIEAVSAALKNQGFETTVVMNPAERELNNQIHFFIKDNGYDTENRLLIYFAGHGHTEKLADGREIGYIVPADAPKPSRDAVGFKQKAISMDTIQGFAKQIQAKHALFVFDSCFSGKLVSRGSPAVPIRIIQEVKKPVRQFITAGAADQTVPDESIFRRMFVRGIEGEADRNKDGYILASELADFLKDKVVDYSDGRQTPQYGKIRDVDLDQGDFVFVVPKTGAADKNKPLRNDEKLRNEPNELDKYLGKYRFEANRMDMEIAKENGAYLLKVPAQSNGTLEKVNGNRYRLKNVPDGFFITVMETEIYLEQPQGNYYLPKVKADGTTENFKATDGLRQIVGIYAPDSRPDWRIEIVERGGAFLLLIPQQPVYKLRETAKDTFINSMLPDILYIKAIRDAAGNVIGIAFNQPDGEMRYRRIIR